MANPLTWHLLPPDLIELQLGQIDLLAAMYPDELTISEETNQLMEDLREGNPRLSPPSDPITASVTLLQPVTTPESDPDQGEAEAKTLEFHLSFPFTYTDDEPDEPPPVKIRIQQPPWLSRAATAQLTSSISPDDDLLSSLDAIKTAAGQQLSLAQESKPTKDTPSDAPGPLVRVWFYFPSISTRAKRDDFIHYAPTYHLTGFLYAGKPGLLCVEGTSRDIDEYMRFIKTESWGDIPAGHKKVSERLREDVVGRVFGDMCEITDSVGERRGVRQNRADMRAVEEWLGERGLGDRLARVLM